MRGHVKFRQVDKLMKFGAVETVDPTGVLRCHANGMVVLGLELARDGLYGGKEFVKRVKCF